jgi:hypothetical protein
LIAEAGSLAPELEMADEVDLAGRVEAPPDDEAESSPNNSKRLVADKPLSEFIEESMGRLVPALGTRIVGADQLPDHHSQEKPRATVAKKSKRTANFRRRTRWAPLAVIPRPFLLRRNSGHR